MKSIRSFDIHSRIIIFQNPIIFFSVTDPADCAVGRKPIHVVSVAGIVLRPVLVVFHRFQIRKIITGIIARAPVGG